jgi:type II secretory pathway component PulF
MTLFAYEAVDSGGTRKSGEIQARSRSEALGKLRTQALQPIRLTERSLDSRKVEPVEKVASAPSGPIRLKSSEVIYFTDEISDLLDAGLQLDPALKIMEQRLRKSNLTRVVTSVRQQICDGKPFSQALRMVSDSFGELYCSMVAAGEVSGTLPQILKRQVGYLVTISELRSRVLQALIYPAFLTSAGLVLLFIFMSVLVPQLSVLFEKTGRSLPLPTRILIASGEFASNYWWAVLLAGGLSGTAFWRIIGTPAGRRWWDRVQLKLPLVGPILCCRFYAQFAHTLANLSGNGLPLLTGLELLARSTPNSHLRSSLDQVVEAVREGKSLSRTMNKVGNFPELMIDLVSVGEQSGDMAAAFRKIGDRYDKELNLRIKQLTAFVQPVIIMAMALLVGLVAYSILTGIFQAVAGLRTK